MAGLLLCFCIDPLRPNINTQILWTYLPTFPWTWHTLFTGSDYDSWRRVKRLSILLRSLVTDNPDNLLEPLTSASSGSELGSKPYSEAYSIPGPAPSSPWSMGDEIRASDNSGPGGTVTKWHKLPSLPLMVLINVVSFSEFIVWERKDVLKSSGFVAELGLVMWNLLDLKSVFIYLFIFIFHSHMPYYYS